jgi:hypothetical protein
MALCNAAWDGHNLLLITILTNFTNMYFDVSVVSQVKMFLSQCDIDENSRICLFICGCCFSLCTMQIFHGSSHQLSVVTDRQRAQRDNYGSECNTWEVGIFCVLKSND